MGSSRKWSYRDLEKVVKGFSNHRRIEMLELLNKDGELSLGEASQRLKINLKTASEHLRRLTLAGLVDKRNLGASVLHCLTRRGSIILKFLRILE